MRFFTKLFESEPTDPRESRRAKGNQTRERDGYRRPRPPTQTVTLPPEVLARSESSHRGELNGEGAHGYDLEHEEQQERLEEALDMDFEIDEEAAEELPVAQLEATPAPRGSNPWAAPLSVRAPVLVPPSPPAAAVAPTPEASSVAQPASSPGSQGAPGGGDSSHAVNEPPPAARPQGAPSAMVGARAPTLTGAAYPPPLPEVSIDGATRLGPAGLDDSLDDDSSGGAWPSGEQVEELGASMMRDPSPPTLDVALAPTKRAPLPRSASNPLPPPLPRPVRAPSAPRAAGDELEPHAGDIRGTGSDRARFARSRRPGSRRGEHAREEGWALLTPPPSRRGEPPPLPRRASRGSLRDSTSPTGESSTASGGRRLPKVMVRVTTRPKTAEDLLGARGEEEEQTDPGMGLPGSRVEPDAIARAMEATGSPERRDSVDGGSLAGGALGANGRGGASPKRSGAARGSSPAATERARAQQLVLQVLLATVKGISPTARGRFASQEGFLDLACTAPTSLLAEHLTAPERVARSLQEVCRSYAETRSRRIGKKRHREALLKALATLQTRARDFAHCDEDDRAKRRELRRALQDATVELDLLVAERGEPALLQELERRSVEERVELVKNRLTEGLPES